MYAVTCSRALCTIYMSRRRCGIQLSRGNYTTLSVSYTKWIQISNYNIFWYSEWMGVWWDCIGIIQKRALVLCERNSVDRNVVHIFFFIRFITGMLNFSNNFWTHWVLQRAHEKGFWFLESDATCVQMTLRKQSGDDSWRHCVAVVHIKIFKLYA